MVEKTYYNPGKPFCGAVKAGNTIFVSGQVPTKEDGTVAGEDIKDQTRAVLEKIKSALEGLGASVTDVVKCTVFLTDIDTFSDMNEAYIEFFETNGFSDSLPARAAMEISRLVKKEWLIEVEAIAIV